MHSSNVKWWKIWKIIALMTFYKKPSGTTAFSYINQNHCVSKIGWVVEFYMWRIFVMKMVLYMSLHIFSNIIRTKHNILWEYLIVKRVFRKNQQIFDCIKAKNVNIKHNYMFLFKNNRRLSVANLKCNFYYRIFVDMKFEKPLYEMKWSKMFNISEK